MSLDHHGKKQPKGKHKTRHVYLPEKFLNRYKMYDKGRQGDHEKDSDTT